jgi:TonB family protein
MIRRLAWAAIASLLACGHGSPHQPRWINPDRAVEVPPCAPRSLHDTLWTVPDLDAPLQVEAIQAPKYPAALQAQRQAGRVEWAFVVGPDGRLDSCSLVLQSASHTTFVEPTRLSLLSAQFAPPLRHGQPVYVRATQTFRFGAGS